MKEDPIKRGMDWGLIWTLFLVIVEISIIWALASQFSYFVLVYGDPSGVHYFVLFGIIGLAGFVAFTIGMAGSRSQERWGTERCKNMIGMDIRFLYKGEVFVLYCILIGTLSGIGAWTLVTVLNALIDNNWSLSVFFDDYVVLDFVGFKIIWQLWIHAVVGGIVGLIGTGMFFSVAWRIATKKFCEAGI